MRKTIALVAITNCITASVLLAGGSIQAHVVNPSMGGMKMDKCMSMMMNSLGKADKNYDLRFINEMIPHHEGAVMMAKDAQQKAQHQEIKELAQNIIDSQQKEIEQMKAWRKAWYNK